MHPSLTPDASNQRTGTRGSACVGERHDLLPEASRRLVGDGPKLGLATYTLLIAFPDVEELAREGLLAMSAGVGLRVIAEMMDRPGRPQAWPDTQANRSRDASAPGSVMVGGRGVPISSPEPAPSTGTEVQLETYATWQGLRRQGRHRRPADSHGAGRAPR